MPEMPLTCDLEPEVGFEPTTFRLRDGCSASTWTAPDGSGLLTLDASSVQTAPDGSRPIVWMIIGIIKAHPTENRMARQAALGVRPEALNPRSAECSLVLGHDCGCLRPARGPSCGSPGD